MSFEREVVLALPEPIVRARHVRSTVLLSSIAAVRAAGFAEQYMAALPPQHGETLRESVVGMWVPMEVAVAHYRACESLALPTESQVTLGRATFDRTQGTLLGTAVKLSRAAGASPWTVLPLFQRFWLRGFDGGGIAVYKLGPKDAQVDCFSVEVNDVRYFRNALRGLVTGVLELFTSKCYVKELTGSREPGAVHFRAQWA